MTELVVMKNKQAVTTSLQIAENFEKSHQHILRDIDELKEGVQNWTDLFLESNYIHPQNKQTYRMFYMNRDGFTLLGMGFTGSKALQFKLKYIDAFNKMEALIKKENEIRIPTNYVEALELALNQAKQIEQKNQVIVQLRPKVEYLDRILKSRSLVTITQIAKDYGMSGARLNRLLHEFKIQYKQSDQWLLYEDYQDKGYTHSETILIEDLPGMEKVVMITKWTMKGRVFLYNLLKSKNIVPTIERE